MTATPPSRPASSAPIYNSRYELSHQIARGGTAQVYLARDLLLDRPVALKVLFPELSSDSSFVERFRREAQAAANLSHPNIVPVFDWGESERTYFIVMEFVDGEPLSSIIRAQAPLPPRRAAAIAIDIAKALSYAHRHGVVHRDVKPGNVLLTRDGQVKVTDFGIARAVGTDDNVTQTGLVMGTATYFSPEQAQGLGVDGRSDVYSLGVVLYEMVTARAPFAADTPVAIAYKHVSETPVPPRELEPRVPEALEAIILRAMAKQPADRYATVEDLQADLQRFGEGVPVQALAPAIVGATGAMTATQALYSPPTSVLGAGAAGAAAGMAATSTLERQPEAAGGGGPTDHPEMPRRRWIPWAIAAVLLAVALALLIYFGGRSLGWFGGTGYVRLPNLVGQNYQTADGYLVGKGLTPVNSPQFSTKSHGIVLSTSPGPDSLVKQNGVVTVVYSKGPAPVAVPAVQGDTLQQAEQTLLHHGFKYVAIPTTRTDSSQPALVVFHQDPAANTGVAPGTTVKLDYYTSTLTVVVPDVTGKPLQEAENTLVNKGLQFSTPVQVVSATVPSGSVVSTNPAAGQTVNSGYSVAINVSAGPGDAVPGVVGKPLAAAEAAITGAGLNYVVQYQQSTAAQKGTVISQSPTSGQVLPGSNVTITVGTGPPPTTTTQPPPTTQPPTSTTTPHKKHHHSAASGTSGGG